jgi:glycosyltransferase involved in cell wall biosynthesis
VVEVLVVGPGGQQTGGISRYIADQCDQLDDHRIRPYNVQPVSGDGLPWFVLTLVSVIWKLAVFPFRRRPDVVHVHTSHWRSFYLSAVYVLIGALVWRRPVILHVHGSSFDEFVETATGFERRFQSLVFEQCSAVVVLSEYWREVLAERVDPDRLVVIRNAVDVETIQPKYTADVPHLVIISNLIVRKGVNELLEAIDRLVEDDEVPPFRVTIAGIGPLEGAVRAAAERHPGVLYRGFVSEPEKHELLQQGSIYVLPSHSEGLPIGLLEGMAGGNAVVATSIGSVPELIGSDNGRLVPPEDSAALTAALRELITHPDTVSAMARSNRALVESSYSWSSVATELGELYRRVLTDRPLEVGRSPMDESPSVEYQ